MSWWGKVVGGTFGFMMGGPLGALLGAALGNYFDGGLDGISLDESLGLGETERVQSIFFTTTFTIMGHIAKSDGRVTIDEIDLTEKIIRQMQLNPQQRNVAINLFNEGKKKNFPLQDVLAQFKRETFRRRNLVQMFLEIIVSTALVDSRLDPKEQNILEIIASELGYDKRQFTSLLSRLSGQDLFSEKESVSTRLKAAYDLLGITENSSDAEVKRAYRKQMSQHHPDKLVAKGLPEEMIDIVNQKTQNIKAAYELIKSIRAK
ncbi:MAG: co-chaperone DjlA [Gammaproteobacteria bacterium]|nr:co-chaperone DjlA [Gammaproteobacteria bacterium]